MSNICKVNCNNHTRPGSVDKSRNTFGGISDGIHSKLCSAPVIINNGQLWCVQ